MDIIIYTIKKTSHGLIVITLLIIPVSGHFLDIFQEVTTPNPQITISAKIGQSDDTEKISQGPVEASSGNAPDYHGPASDTAAIAEKYLQKI